MMPGNEVAPMATPKTLPSQNRRSRIALGAGRSPASGASGAIQRRPHM
jgi:hypothetical protein